MKEKETSLGILCLKLHTLCAAPLYLLVSWQQSLTLVSIFIVFLHEFSFANVKYFNFSCSYECFFVKCIIFYLQSQSSSLPLLEFYTNFHIVFTSLYIMFIFHSIRCLYRRHCIPAIFSPKFVVFDYSGLLLHEFILLIRYSRLK